MPTPVQVHYLGPPRPPFEAERLATVRALGKLDKPDADPEIASILKLVATVFKVGQCVRLDKRL